MSKCLPGPLFREVNDVALRPAKREVLQGNGSTYTYGSKALLSSFPTVRRAVCTSCPYPFQDSVGWRILEITATRRRSI